MLMRHTVLALRGARTNGSLLGDEMSGIAADGEIVVGTRRRFCGVLACGALVLPAAMADVPLGPPPAPLDVKLKSRTHYVLLGVPRRILFLSADAVHDFYQLRERDAVYARLIQQGAPEPEIRAHLRSVPFEYQRFQLGEEGAAQGRPLPYLEFDVNRILYRHSHVQPEWRAERRIYFALGSGLTSNLEYRRAWEGQLGKEVILLTQGPARATDPTYLPTRYPVHYLVVGSHMMDQMPLPRSELPLVGKLAQRLGMVPVETP